MDDSVLNIAKINERINTTADTIITESEYTNLAKRFKGGIQKAVAWSNFRNARTAQLIRENNKAV